MPNALAYCGVAPGWRDRKSTRLNSSHSHISYAVFCLKKKLLILGAVVFLPRSIFPDMLSTTALPVAVPLGPTALRLALVVILACVASAAVETALARGYNVCQFFGFKWDKNLPPREVPVFTGTWVAMVLVALLL